MFVNLLNESVIGYILSSIWLLAFWEDFMDSKLLISFMEILCGIKLTYKSNTVNKFSPSINVKCSYAYKYYYAELVTSRKYQNELLHFPSIIFDTK